ncbi:fructose-6-phosphate aldolase [Streptococcus gallolyticus]|uniref:fructose-6-phosphate aldolase n=1 Tax=Streptococcus hepaticus TaxID=3349163 RepID=UPI001C97695D|nr:fructose-6-phosphate aldolase [Streptococcus gallolyticus]MBY5041551.1 fructose-6-phosphate aldolase [Streptococcus gallolyticus]
MEFLLDTANIEAIKTYSEIIPISGVTSNPSIVKKEGKIDFFQHMKQIREIIGSDKSLHVQVVAQDFQGMIKDAETILEQIDTEVYIKVPVTTEGLKVIQELKKRNVHVTATAIYTKFQAYLAIEAGSDYIAPYFNRMENLNINATEAIRDIQHEIDRTGSSTKILAASFKNISQVNAAIATGAEAVTFGTDIVEQGFAMPSIEKAVKDFTADWESIFGVDSTVYSLN